MLLVDTMKDLFLLHINIDKQMHFFWDIYYTIGLYNYLLEILMALLALSN